LDASRRALCVADPNGALVPGGNMEFLVAPPHMRAKPSTKWSRFDLDALEAKNAPGKSGKKRKAALKAKNAPGKSGKERKA